MCFISLSFLSFWHTHTNTFSINIHGIKLPNSKWLLIWSIENMPSRMISVSKWYRLCWHSLPFTKCIHATPFVHSAAQLEQLFDLPCCQRFPSNSKYISHLNSFGTRALFTLISFYLHCDFDTAAIFSLHLNPVERSVQFTSLEVFTGWAVRLVEYVGFYVFARETSSQLGCVSPV